MAGKTTGRLLRDEGPIVAEILEGKHDGLLSYIEQAVAHRRKVTVRQGGIVRGAKVSVADDPRAGEFAGRAGVVKGIGKLRATVEFPCEKCGGATKAVPVEGARRGAVVEALVSGCECYGIPDEAGIPFDLLTVAA